MNEQNMNQEKLSPNAAVPFTYPEGFAQVAKTLEFLPDDGSREMMLSILVSVALYL